MFCALQAKGQLAWPDDFKNCRLAAVCRPDGKVRFLVKSNKLKPQDEHSVKLFLSEHVGKNPDGVIGIMGGAHFAAFAGINGDQVKVKINGVVSLVKFDDVVKFIKENRNKEKSSAIEDC